jgi:DNA polymerase sigma
LISNKIKQNLFKITKDRCKPTTNDIDKRTKILTSLEKQFQKDYPECNLHAFGSFYNGFGFQQSDLDVCIVFKDEREHNVCILKIAKSHFNSLSS